MGNSDNKELPVVKVWEYVKGIKKNNE
jgi:hypothetical protein